MRTNMNILGVTDINMKNIYLADYQRPVDKDRVLAIVQDYNEDRDRPIEVSLRDGKYWCFDGQHRLYVHKMLGMDTIAAQVHVNLTYEQEAALFAKQYENVQAVSTADRWNAAIEAGDSAPETKKIRDICNDMGFKVSTEKNSEPNTISCIRELQSIYRDCGERGLRVILKLVKDTWDMQQKNTNNMILGGLHYIYTHYGEEMTAERWKRMAKALGAYTPKKFLHEVAVEDRRGYKGVAQQIVAIHNKGLTGRNKNRLNKEMLCSY